MPYDDELLILHLYEKNDAIYVNDHINKTNEN